MVKCFLYKVTVYEGVMDFIHDINAPPNQYRLYIPKVGVIAYGFREEKLIDFSSDSEGSIREGEKNCNECKEKGQLVRELELPDDLVQKVIDTGKQLKQVRSVLEENGKLLIERIGS